MTPGTGQGWTLLTSHGHVLVHVAANPTATVREITEALGISERRVIAVLHDLEEAGMVRSRRVGKRKHHKVIATARFRHPSLRHVPVGAITKLLRPRVLSPASLRWRG